jgi:archaeoflavoprotein AfpA
MSITLLQVVWGITGSGDHLGQIVEIVGELNADDQVRVRVLVSKAGEQVLRWYKLWDELNQRVSKVQVEVNANAPFLAGPLQLGKYDLLVVAPLTANSTAKIVHGIADTLITNAVAQTLKGPTPVVLYPVDQTQGSIPATGPGGEQFEVHIRDIDSQNAGKLREMSNTTVLPSPEHIRDYVYSIVLKKGEECC